MPQAIPAIGSHVVFHQLVAASKDAPQHHETFDALVVGYDRPGDHDPEVHGLPQLNLQHFNPKNSLALSGAGWRESFVLEYGVPHVEVNDEGPNHYSVPSVAIPGVLPSAADLDAVAEEQKIKEATDKPKGAAWGKKNGK